MASDTTFFGFESGDFSDVSLLGNGSVETDSFPTAPTEGDFQALLTNSGIVFSETEVENFLALAPGSLDALGNGDAVEGSAVLLEDVTVEAGSVLSFDWSYLTDELPASFFNDFAFVSIGGEVFTLADTNSSLVSGTLFSGETGYTSFEFQFETATTLDIGFGILDVGDFLFSSGLLLDNIRIGPGLLGTDESDSLNGTATSERISGLGDDDFINGNGGLDTLLGGSGQDQISGGNEADFIDGGDGDDILFGNEGENTLVGGAGNDQIFGGTAADTILAGTGDDQIFSNGGGDLIDSGSGFDVVQLGGDATVILEVGEGYDTLNNFQLGMTQLSAGAVASLQFADTAAGVSISVGDDLLAIVSNQSASTLNDNAALIFV